MGGTEAGANSVFLFSSDLEAAVGVPEGSKVGQPGPGHPLSPLALHCKAESVVSVTSQCSFSSTIVHVGDKKPLESGQHPAQLLSVSCPASSSFSLSLCLCLLFSLSFSPPPSYISCYPFLLWQTS